MRAEMRNADLKRRFDTRSRQRVQANPLPIQFLTMKPWWELNQIRTEQEAKQTALHKPVLQPMRRVQPVMPPVGMVARANRMFGIGMPAYG